MNPSLSTQASQAATQGQQLESQDETQAGTSSNDYTTYSNDATQANQNLQAETQYMQGAGSGQNVYNTQLSSGEQAVGFDPSQLGAANKSLFSATGTLNGANSAFSQPGGVGGYGMSAGALGSYEGSILAPLQTGVSNANTEVGTLNNELGTLQTGANQSTTAQVQSEQNTVTGLTAAVQNYQTQASAALQNMQFYSQLASTQGSLNAQEQQNYAAAVQAYAAAQQAIAQSKYLIAQTTGQNITNTADQNQLNATTKSATPSNYVPSTPTPNASSNGGGSSILGSLGKTVGSIGSDLTSLVKPSTWLPQGL